MGVRALPEDRARAIERAEALKMDETRLEMATRHVGLGREIVQRQRRLVADLRARGIGTTNAESLLAMFERLLAMMEGELASIQQD